MPTSRHMTLLKSAAPALVLAGMLMPSAAQATETDGLQAWKECVGDRPVDTRNAPAFDPALFERGPGVDVLNTLAQQGGVLDTNPAFDEVVLDFEDHVAHREVLDWGARNGLRLRLNSIHSDAPNVYIARVEEGAVPFIKTCLEADDSIESIEENIEYVTLGTPSPTVDVRATPGSQSPDDPLYPFQWNFEQVNAEQAWRVSTGQDVVVAVIDTGVALENAPERGIKRPRDLDGTHAVDGYDFVDDDAFAWDGHGHGTHVAGTIAQTTHNAFGVAGLAYDASIMPLRVLNSRGFGQVADIADAVRFAADEGAQVINMSLGGPLPSLVLSRAIKYAYNKGVTVVAAAGNGGKRAPSYPAAYKHTIAVAATQFDQSTTFYSQWGDFVDIAAPGGNTRVDQNNDGQPDGVMQETLKNGRTDAHDFALYMGTSMASPHVAAAAALVHARGVTHPDRVEEILTSSADPSQSERFDNPKEFNERYGAGLLQADAAARDAVVNQGIWRMAAGITLALLALARVRRRDLLGLPSTPQWGVVTTSALAASGLFFLPLIMGDLGAFNAALTALSHPIAELDLALLGPGAHQNPLLASFLIPLIAVGLLGGTKRGRLLGAGVGLGMAAFLLTEAFLLTSDVQWIPGMNLLDRAWLAANGLISATVGYLGLKRY